MMWQNYICNRFWWRTSLNVTLIVNFFNISATLLIKTYLKWTQFFFVSWYLLHTACKWNLWLIELMKLYSRRLSVIRRLKNYVTCLIVLMMLHRFFFVTKALTLYLSAIMCACFLKLTKLIDAGRTFIMDQAFKNIKNRDVQRKGN